MRGDRQNVHKISAKIHSLKVVIHLLRSLSGFFPLPVFIFFVLFFFLPYIPLKLSNFFLPYIPLPKPIISFKKKIILYSS